jgi:putative peptidoglycan lipid II flippase
MPTLLAFVRRLSDRLFPRGALTLSILSLGYFGMGLVRNRVLSTAFGSSAEYEAYLAAFRIPEIAFDVVVAAGLTAPFVPIFTGLRARDPASADRFGQTVLTGAVLVIAVLSLVIVVIAPTTADWIAPDFDPPTRELYISLLRLSCVSQVLFAASFVLGEVLVAHRRFFLYALAPLLYTGGIIAGTVLLAGRLGVAGAAIGAVAGAAAHLVVRSIGIARTSFRPRPRLAIRTPEFREFVRLMLPRMVSHPIDPLTVAFFTRLATGIGVGALTSYNYASDYQVVPVSLVGSAFSLAVFPALATAWNEGDGPTFRAILRRNLVTIAGLTIVAAVLLAILARPIVEIVHAGGRFTPADVERTAFVLALFAISIPLDSLAYPLSRALYASHNTILQVAASLAGFAALVGAASSLSGPLGIAAIPLGYALGTAVKSALLAMFLQRRLRLLPAGGISPLGSSG